MSDNFYKKQLEAFGIESMRATEGDIERKRQEDQREILQGVVATLMSSIEGRHWIFSWLERCNVFMAPFVPNDPYGTAFFCGIQSVGQTLLVDVMAAAPEQFYLMIQEADARKKKKNVT